MNNSGPLFESNTTPKKKKGTGIIAEIFIFAFIGGLVFVMFFLNKNNTKPEEITTTTTTTTTIRTTTTEKKTTKSTTRTTYTTHPGTTGPKQHTLEGIVNDIRRNYNVYSVNTLESIGFVLTEPPQGGLRMNTASVKYYREMLDGKEEVEANNIINSKVTIKHYSSRTVITTRNNGKEYTAYSVKRIKGYLYNDKSGWFDIFLLNDEGVYRFSNHGSVSFTKVTTNVYTDMVVHPKASKTIYYYVKETNENNKVTKHYYNINNTSKEETHDEITDAYDNGIIKIKTNRDFYLNGVSQGFKYGFTIVDKNNINRFIVGSDSTVYEYFYNTETKTVNYRKLKEAKAYKYLLYDRGNKNNYLVILFKDNSEIIRDNYYIKELPNDLT